VSAVEPGAFDALVAGVLDGDRRALARALTVVEDDEAGLRTVVAALHAHTGRARVIALTGAPGVGKSTLASALTATLRARGDTVAVVAVDPSSPVTGGALLGDRIRMQGHHDDPGVFIRSMAARGRLGGMAAATPHAVAVLDAAGFDVVLVETVGVGQSEVEVAATAETTVVVLAPGAGDGVQAAKAGILEVADVLVVNQADRDGAAALEVVLGGAFDSVLTPASWRPPIVPTVAVRDEGVDALLGACDAHLEHLRAGGGHVERRKRRAEHAIREIAMVGIRRALGGDPVGAMGSLPRRVADRELDPFAAADLLLTNIAAPAAD
jgi:LAO/AO transport system kinase